MENMTDDARQAVLDTLKQLEIPYQLLEHPPVYTVEEAQVYWSELPGTPCKNLFLRDQKGKNYYLVIVEETKSLNMQAFCEKHQLGKLSFASAERLMNVMGLAAGSVSPFGLIHPNARAVEVLIDSDLKSAEALSFHPNVNTATISLSVSDFDRFLGWCGNSVRWVAV